jgi:hypothetical protein
MYNILCTAKQIELHNKNGIYELKYGKNVWYEAYVQGGRKVN